jgi:hypothetical protein
MLRLRFQLSVLNRFTGSCSEKEPCVTTPCPAGSFCPSDGMSVPSPCSPGNYCPFNKSTAPTPCPDGNYCPESGISSPPGYYCPTSTVNPSPCPANTFSPSWGIPQLYQCTPCSDGQTSKAGAATCDSCAPSAFDPDKFKCFSDLSKAGVIIGYIVSFFSSIFSAYKARIFVRERMQRLQAAGVKPTLKRVVFVERALANHSKHMLLSLADRGAVPDEGNAGSEDAVVLMVRGVQRQLQEQQQQL